MSVLEKLGTIAMGYALLFNTLSYGESPVLSHGVMALGSVLLLTGGEIEDWLHKRFPSIDW